MSAIPLEPGLNEFVCIKCGHHVGDGRQRNWTGVCPKCDRITRFCMIVE